MATQTYNNGRQDANQGRYNPPNPHTSSSQQRTDYSWGHKAGKK